MQYSRNVWRNSAFCSGGYNVTLEPNKRRSLATQRAAALRVLSGPSAFDSPKSGFQMPQPGTGDNLGLQPERVFSVRRSLLTGFSLLKLAGEGAPKYVCACVYHEDGM